MEYGSAVRGSIDIELKVENKTKQSEIDSR